MWDRVHGDGAELCPSLICSRGSFSDINRAGQRRVPKCRVPEYSMTLINVVTKVPQFVILTIWSVTYSPYKSSPIVKVLESGPLNSGYSVSYIPLLSE